MHDLAEKYGFKYTGSCYCNGYYTEKFKRGDYKLRWRKKRHLGMILLYGSSITKWIKISDIDEALSKIFVQAEA